MILITGGGGFIGLNLARYLIDKGQNVLLVRRHAFEVPSFLSPYVGKQVITVQGDISDLPVLYSSIKTYNVESIIHAAVVTETSEGSSLYQAVKVNTQGTADLLEAARIFNLRRVTFLSSIAVYFPCRESQESIREDGDLPVNASEWIAGTKKAAEQICLLYAAQYNMSVPIIRPPQVWGPLYWTHRSPVHTMIENALAGRASNLPVYADSSSPYIYVRDAAKGISLVHLAPALKHDIYNIADSRNHTLAEFARTVREAIPGAQIKLSETRTPKDRVLPPMNIDRIKSDLSFTPDYDLNRAVRAYVAWLRDSKYV